MLQNVIVLLACFLLSQEVPLIDLTTAPVYPRVKEPTQGRVIGGAAGGEPSWPLQVKLVSARQEMSEEASFIVYEIELRNTGKNAIDFPVDPSLRDIEPAGPSVKSYEYVSALITIQAQPARGRLKLKPLGLYGAESSPGTQRRLMPGDAIRIRAKARFTQESDGAVPNGLSPPFAISAFLTLYREVVTGDSVETRQFMGPIESSNLVPIADP